MHCGNSAWCAVIYMGQLVTFGGSPLLNRAVVSEGSLYGSPVHWPQPINSKSLHRSTGAGKGAVTCPRPSYYFNTLCLPLRSFYLSDFSRTHHLRPSRGQTGVSRHEERGGVRWFIVNVGCWVFLKRSARMDSEHGVWWGWWWWGVSDEPDCDGKCLWHREAELTPEQLLGGLSRSHWWAFAALWWPYGPDSGGISRESPGVWEWFIYHRVSLYGPHHKRWPQMLLSSGGRSGCIA